MKNFKQYLTEVQKKKELVTIVPYKSTSVVEELKGKSVADFTTTETYMKKNPSETKNKDLVYSGGEVRVLYSGGKVRVLDPGEEVSMLSPGEEVSGFGVASWKGNKVVESDPDSIEGLLTETSGRTMSFFYLLA